MSELCYCLHWAGHHEATVDHRDQPDRGRCTRCACRVFASVSHASRHLYQRGTKVVARSAASVRPTDRILVTFTIRGELRPVDTKTGALVARVREKTMEGYRWSIETDLGPTVELWGDTALLVASGAGG